MYQGKAGRKGVSLFCGGGSYKQDKKEKAASIKGEMEKSRCVSRGV